MIAVERAYQLAKSGECESFTQLKKAMRKQFDVDRELVGRQLSADLTRLSREARAARQSEV